MDGEEEEYRRGQDLPPPPRQGGQRRSSKENVPASRKHGSKGSATRQQVGLTSRVLVHRLV